MRRFKANNQVVKAERSHLTSPPPRPRLPSTLDRASSSTRLTWTCSSRSYSRSQMWTSLTQSSTWSKVPQFSIWISNLRTVQMRGLNVRRMKLKKMRPRWYNCSVSKIIWAKSSMNKEPRVESQFHLEAGLAKSSHRVWWHRGTKTVYRPQISCASSKNETSTSRDLNSQLTRVAQRTLNMT